MREPKQQRSQRTLAKILAAAVELFESQGVDATAITHVAKRAGSSVGSLYGRFEGKTDLVRAVDQLLWDRVAVRWSSVDESALSSTEAGAHQGSGSSTAADTPGLLARLNDALAPEHAARASIHEYLKREGGDSAGPTVLALLVLEVQDALAAQLTTTQSVGHALDVLGFLARIAVDEANAGRGSSAVPAAAPEEMARLSIGDSLDGKEGDGHLAFVIEATLRELGGGPRVPEPEPDRAAPAVDPFDIWA